MKKILLIAAILTGFNVAFADEMNTEAMDQTAVEMTGGRGDAIVGGIIGGVIGGIIGGVIADNGHGHHRPGHVVCYARNMRGQMYRAFGRNSRMVQRDAMNQCLRFSRNCRPAGCQF